MFCEFEMNNPTVNLTTPKAFINSTTHSFHLLFSSLEQLMLGINFLFSLPTHSYVIWLIITGSGIVSEFFSLNLSVCEIGNCLNCLFYVLNNWTSSVLIFEYFLKGFVITGRPLFQCLICVERYLAVIHPVTFLKFKPLRYRVICCTAAWIICLGSCLSCMCIMVLFTINIFTWFLSVQFLLFLSIQLFCCVAVLRALKQSGPGERRREREEENHMKRRAFNIILITTVSMLLTYVPYILSGIFAIMTSQLIHVFWLTGLIFYLLAGFVQPVLYLTRVRKLSCLTWRKFIANET